MHRLFLIRVCVLQPNTRFAQILIKWSKFATLDWNHTDFNKTHFFREFPHPQYITHFCCFSEGNFPQKYIGKHKTLIRVEDKNKTFRRIHFSKVRKKSGRKKIFIMMFIKIRQQIIRAFGWDLKKDFGKDYQNFLLLNFACLNVMWNWKNA